jgi:predicted ATPase
VTLIGPGGVGKTRLLIEVGHRLRTARPERAVVMCELAVANEESALDLVAAALAIDRRADDDLVDGAAAVLADAEVVLLLDNCEHVLNPIVELVERLLSNCPKVSIVATSRERLRVAGEQLFAVPALPTAADDGPAVRLFVDRARAVTVGFERDAAAASAITEIVRRLDGLPLAIELAAARLHTLDVDEVAAGLDERFELHSSGPAHRGALGDRTAHEPHRNSPRPPKPATEPSSPTPSELRSAARRRGCSDESWRSFVGAEEDRAQLFAGGRTDRHVVA